MAMVGHKTESVYRRYAIVEKACWTRRAWSSRRFTTTAGSAGLPPWCGFRGLAHAGARRR